MSPLPAPASNPPPAHFARFTGKPYRTHMGCNLVVLRSDRIQDRQNQQQRRRNTKFGWQETVTLFWTLENVMDGR